MCVCARVQLPRVLSPQHVTHFKDTAMMRDEGGMKVWRWQGWSCWLTCGMRGGGQGGVMMMMLNMLLLLLLLMMMIMTTTFCF